MPSKLQRPNPALLLDQSFRDHTSARLAPGGVLSVAITGASEADRSWIEGQLARLDALIDLDFALVVDPAQAVLRIAQVVDGSGLEGISLPDEQGWELRWQATGPGGLAANPNDRNTIVHELGHTLGLGHPGGDPTSKRYNTATTVMSYRPGPKGWNDWYSQADLAALQQTWAPERATDGSLTAITSRGPLPLTQVLSGAGVLQGGVGSDWLTGSTGDDQLFGDAAADVLIGGPGADRIVPGPGADIVTTCRDGAADRVELSGRPSRKAIPLLEGLDPIDRVVLSGGAGRAVAVRPASLDGLSGLGVFVDRRLAALVADPGLSRGQLSGMIQTLA